MQNHSKMRSKIDLIKQENVRLIGKLWVEAEKMESRRTVGEESVKIKQISLSSRPEMLSFEIESRN